MDAEGRTMPGPKKGEGGRPRKANPKGRPGDGYKRTTVGPKGKGKQTYLHRKVAKVVGKGRNVTVNHKNRKTGDNRKGNLTVMSRAKNTALGNKARKKK
jgi:hypothetical protein